MEHGNAPESFRIVSNSITVTEGNARALSAKEKPSTNDDKTEAVVEEKARREGEKVLKGNWCSSCDCANKQDDDLMEVAWFEGRIEVMVKAVDVRVHMAAASTVELTVSNLIMVREREL